MMELTVYEMVAIYVPLTVLAIIFIWGLHQEFKRVDEEEKECEETYSRIKNLRNKGE